MAALVAVVRGPAKLVVQEQQVKVITAARVVMETPITPAAVVAVLPLLVLLASQMAVTEALGQLLRILVHP
jgi:hypothetical protein